MPRLSHTFCVTKSDISGEFIFIDSSLFQDVALASLSLHFILPMPKLVMCLKPIPVWRGCSSSSGPRCHQVTSPVWLITLNSAGNEAKQQKHPVGMKDEIICLKPNWFHFPVLSGGMGGALWFLPLLQTGGVENH